MNSYDRTVKQTLDFLCARYPDRAESLSLDYVQTTTWDDLLNIKKGLHERFSHFILQAFTALYFDEIKAKIKALAEGPIEAMASIDLKSRAYSYRGNRLLSLVDNPDMEFVRFLRDSKRNLTYKLTTSIELGIQDLKRFAQLDYLYYFNERYKNDMTEERYVELLNALKSIYELYEKKKAEMFAENKLLVQSTSEKIYTDYPQLKGVVAYDYEP